MKTKLISTYILILSVMSLYANTDKYRLILVDNPSSTITIGWNQISGTNPIVHYGTVDLGNTTPLAYPNTKSVDRSQLFRGMDNRFARLTGLLPNTNYYFVIEDSEGVSDRFWFRTAPADNSRLSFIAGGDSRNNRVPRQNANLLVSKLEPHAVLFGGDMTDDDTNLEWQNWFDDWQLTTASNGRMFPIIPARGNHEFDANTIYNLFDTPNANSYYAITFGANLIRTYTLNSEISVVGDQLTWLQGDLDNSASLIWKMAQYHKPMRPHTGSKPENNYIYNAWAQLFYNKGVRLVVDCDSHMVKTTWPVKPSSASGNDEGFVVDNTNGTVYAGEGTWGAPLRDANDTKSWTRSSGKFNQFKLIFVDDTKIEMRTILVDNAGTVETGDNDPFTLPPSLNVFNPPTGDVVTISNSAPAECPEQFIPCDDGNPDTIYDEEDGNCNCAGFDTYDYTEYTTDVNASTDDAEENVASGIVTLDSSDLELINDSGNNQVVGIRFDQVNVPDGAVIERAYIQFSIDESVSSPQPITNLVIHGEDSSNSSTFLANVNDISSRNLTSISKNWDNVPEWGDNGTQGYNQRTPNLSAIVNEIMANPGWVYGNPISFVISGSGTRFAHAFDKPNNEQPPKLILVYESNCPIKSVALGTTGACNVSTDTYTQELIITYEDAPVTGTINVNGQSFAIQTSPQTVTLTNLPADGLDVDIEAYFTAEPTCIYSRSSFYEAPSNCSGLGQPDNVSGFGNLALLPEATISGSVTGGRGTPNEILYNSSTNSYETSTAYNEYGVSFGFNMGTPTVDDGLKWQVNWPNVKAINYITFGGSYENQPQPNTMWRVSYRNNGVWTIIDEGQGGWIDGGIFEWRVLEADKIVADALRVQLYSDGVNSVVSIHLRARGGTSSQVDDSDTTTKATLIQYLPDDLCGVFLPTPYLVYCSNTWYNGTSISDISVADGTTDVVIGDGTYTIEADTDLVLNSLEVLSGASLVIKEGGSLILNGNLINNGIVELQSISTKYSSLIVGGTVTGNVNYKRHVNAYNGVTGNDLIASPVTDQEFGEFASDNPNIFENPSVPVQKLFGPYDELSGNYETYFTTTNNNTTLMSGEGYRAARDASEDGVSGTNFTFIGGLQTGPVDIDITNLNSGWNLIGNPYSSYLDFDTFFSLNSSQLDTGTYNAVYGYDGDATNGWTILNGLTTGELIAPGQGFFVKSQTGGGTISFTPAMRVKGTSDDFILGRSSNSSHLGIVRITIHRDSNSFDTDIYFNTNATLGLDPGYDASLFGGNAPDFSVYTHLVEDNSGTPLGIQALGESALNDVIIPLGIHASQGDEITVDLSQNTIPSSINIYLEDTVKNSFTPLNDTDYTFVLDSDLSNVGRFYLRLENVVLGTNEPEIELLKIFTNPAENTIVINGQLESDTKYTLYDLHGRAVRSGNLDSNNTTQSISTAQLSTGIYIIELVNENLIKRIEKLIIK